MTATAVTVKGFFRRRYLLILLAVTAVTAFFMWRTVHLRDGIGALIVLTLASLALARWGGPNRLAREVVISPDRIEIRRFTAIATTIARRELAEARVVRGKTCRLVLTPKDLASFIVEHPELADARVRKSVQVPIGQDAGTADAIEAALSVRR